jgi:hypothetical protein
MLGIEQLREPLPGECVGRYGRLGLPPGLLWDWWPSFFTADRVDPLATSPASIPLTEMPLPDHSYLGPTLATPGGVIAAGALASAGLDLESARLLAVSPDGDWVVLADRETDPAKIAAGRARRLWLFGGASYATGSMTPRVVPLPAIDVHQFVFDAPGHALVLADGGSRILSVSLATGALSELESSSPQRFRGSGYISNPGGEARMSGNPQDVDGNAGPDFLARFVGGAAPRLDNVGEIGPPRALASTLGTTIGEIPGPEGRWSFVVDPSGGGEPVLVSAGGGGGLTTLDDDVAPIGLAVSGRRILYFKQIPDLGGLEVRVRDLDAAAPMTLTRGVYHYPYLVAGGEKALFTSVDWEDARMTLWTMAVPSPEMAAAGIPPSPPNPILTCGIGAVRVAEDGSAFAVLAPEGLHYWGAIPTAVVSGTGNALALLPCRPNPARGGTRVGFTLAETRRVRLEVIDLAGRRVAELADQRLGPGLHERFWDGRDARGRLVGAGIYFVRLRSGEDQLESRFSLVR